MKRCFLFLFLLAFSALPSVFADSQDDAAAIKAIRQQQKTMEGRDAMLKQQEQENAVDYEALAQKAAREQKKLKQRENNLRGHFENVYLPELAKARRVFDLDTFAILQDEAQIRYKKDPSRRINRFALANIYLFDCEYQTFLYNTTETMYQKPLILKTRADSALKGLVLVEKLQVDSPKDPELWRLKGVFLSCQIDKKFSHSRNFVDAEAALKKAMALGDSEEEPEQAKLALARFYFNQPAKRGRDVEKALALAKTLTNNDNFVALEAHLIVGRAAEEKYDYDTAYDEFRDAHGIEMKNPEAFYFYNLAKRDRKRFHKLMKSP